MRLKIMDKIKVGMVGGGGPKSFFGNVHRFAIALDTTRSLTAGALRSNPDDSIEAARGLGIRGFPDYRAMLEAHKKGEMSLDYVTIVTTNEAHYSQARTFIEDEVPVLCEKPMTFNVEEARELGELIEDKKVPFILAHTYTGHAMVMLAREFVHNGDIGRVRKVEAWYNQGWLSEPVEAMAVPQAQWRFNPKRAGISCCGGDIGTHAYMAARWVTGLEVVKVSARLNTFVEGRVLDDDFNVIAELENGATAIITATQIAVGYKNDNGFRIFGSKGSIEWHQERAEKLLVRRGRTDEIYWIGANFDYFPAKIKPYLRLPGGHHEDYFAALANLHLTMEFMVRKRRGEKEIPEAYPHPGVTEGIGGMEFVAAAVKSSRGNGVWIDSR